MGNKSIHGIELTMKKEISKRTYPNEVEIGGLHRYLLG